MHSPFSYIRIAACFKLSCWSRCFFLFVETFIEEYFCSFNLPYRWCITQSFYTQPLFNRHMHIHLHTHTWLTFSEDVFVLLVLLHFNKNVYFSNKFTLHTVDCIVFNTLNSIIRSIWPQTHTHTVTWKIVNEYGNGSNWFHSTLFNVLAKVFTVSLSHRIQTIVGRCHLLFWISKIALWILQKLFNNPQCFG